MGRLCSRGLVLAEKMWFLPLISYWEFVTPIFFSAVIVSGRRDLPSDARTFIAAKKAHQSSARRRHVRIRRPVYKRLFKSNRVLRADRKKRYKWNLSTVSVLANRSLHQDLMLSGCRGTTVSDVCLQALTLSLPSPQDFFHPFPK